MKIEDKENLFRYSYVHLLPEEQIGMHEQNTWELSYVIHGAGMRHIGDTMMAFKSGDVVFIPPHIPHCWYFNGNSVDNRGRIANISLVFSKGFLHSIYSAFQEMEESVTTILKLQDAISFSSTSAKKIKEILLSMSDMKRRWQIGASIQLISVIADNTVGNVVGKYVKKDKSQKKMDIIQTYITCNYQHRISLDDISAHVGMNKSAFCIFFKKMTGKTFVEYLNEYSINQACKMLKEKDLSVAEICYQAGFNDVPYFNRIFKRIVGVPPTLYAKKG